MKSRCRFLPPRKAWSGKLDAQPVCMLLLGSLHVIDRTESHLDLTLHPIVNGYASTLTG